MCVAHCFLCLAFGVLCFSCFCVVCCYCWWLVVVRCLLMVVGCLSLLVDCCLLRVGRCLFDVACLCCCLRTLFVVRGVSLFVVRC